MEHKKKVLLIRLSSMGDVIFNIPLANVLKRKGYYVCWVVAEKGLEIVKNNPAVDEYIYIPTKIWKTFNIFKNIRKRIEILKYIRSQKFDIAIDTQGLLKSGFWCLFSGAKRRITSTAAREFAVLAGNEILTNISGLKDMDTHSVTNYLKYAKYLDLNTDNIEVSLPNTPPETIEKVDCLLENIDKSKPLVAIAPATTWDPKHWDKDNWKDLVKQIEKDYTLVFTGGPNDLDLINYISNGKHLNLAGQTSILELAEVFRRGDLVISLDSGSTHLAWATKKPKILSIFCCTPPKKYAPLGSPDKYISVTGKLPCQPCHKRKCPLKENQNQCTLQPSVNEVLDAIYKLLPNNK